MSKNAEEIAKKYGGTAVKDPAAISKKYGGSTAATAPTPAPETPQTSMWERIPGFFPSWRTAARVGGAIVGGAVGAGTIGGSTGGVGLVPGMMAGGAAGASIGESLFQLGEHALGKGPKTADEAAKLHTEALIEGGLQEGVTGIMAKTVPKMLRSGASKRIAEAVHPGTEGEKAAVREAAEFVAEEFPVAATEQGLLKKLRTKLNSAGIQLERAYNSIPTGVRFKTSAIKQELLKKRQELFLQGEVVPGKNSQLKAYDEIIEWFDRHPGMSIQDLRQNKQLWDELVHWYRGSLSKEPAQEEVFRESANAVRDYINNTFRAVGNANKKVSHWKTITDSLARADTKQVGKVHSRLMDIPVGIVSGAVGGWAGGAQGAYAGTLAGVAIRELMSTTFWKTASPFLRKQAVSALESGKGLPEAVGILSGRAVGMRPGH